MLPALMLLAAAADAGGPVELTGLAEDAKGGAVLVVDGNPIYLRKLASWPQHLRGKTVKVKGRLVKTKLIPSPTKNAKGEISQGAEGEQWVLEDATY